MTEQSRWELSVPLRRRMASAACALLLISFIIPVHLGAAAENQVLEQANKAGIRQCMPAVEAISRFLIGSDKHGADDAYPGKDTDRQIYSTTIERLTPEGSRLISLSVAPVTAGNCSLVYDQVQWFDAQCLVVAKERFPELRYKGVLAGQVAVLEGPATVYLFPAGTGCLTLKKEVITNANALNPAQPKTTDKTEQQGRRP